MTSRRVDPDALLDLAIETLRADVLPALQPEQRYAGAMIANALEIARRGLPGEAEAAEWALLDDLYDDGEGSLNDSRATFAPEACRRAGRRRAGECARTLLMAELRVTDPKCLASRGIAG